MLSMAERWAVLDYRRRHYGVRIAPDLEMIEYWLSGALREPGPRGYTKEECELLLEDAESGGVGVPCEVVMADGVTFPALTICKPKKRRRKS